MRGHNLEMPRTQTYVTRAPYFSRQVSGPCVSQPGGLRPRGRACVWFAQRSQGLAPGSPGETPGSAG